MIAEKRVNIRSTKMTEKKHGKLISNGAPVYVPRKAEKIYKLLKWWIYQSVAGITYVVPPLFYTDLASIPAPLFWLEHGEFNYAAIAHDFL